MVGRKVESESVTASTRPSDCDFASPSIRREQSIAGKAEDWVSEGQKP